MEGIREGRFEMRYQYISNCNSNSDSGAEQGLEEEEGRCPQSATSTCMVVDGGIQR